MEGVTDVETEDEEVDVVTKAYAGAGGEVGEEVSPRELSAGTRGVVAQQPHVADVEEDGAGQVTHETETILGVGLQLDVANLINVGVGVIPIRGEATGADAADGEGPDAVGSADVELLAVRSGRGIAVAVDDAAPDAEGKALVAVYVMIVT